MQKLTKYGAVRLESLVEKTGDPYDNPDGSQ